MSDSHKGKKLTDEHKKNLSIARKGKGGLKGELNNFYGKNHTDESKLKMSSSLKGRKGLSGESNYSSKIILDIQTGIFYFGVREASESTIFSASYLENMLSVKSKAKNKTNLIVV